jgi:hypothetical protein
MPIPLGILAAAGVRAAGGSYELLQTYSLSSSQATVTFSNLATSYAADYQHLQIRFVAQGTRTGGNMELYATANGLTSYRSHWLVGNGSTVSSSTLSYSKMFLGNITGADSTSQFGAGVIDILDPFESKNKTVRTFIGTTSAPNRVAVHSALIETTSQLSSFTFDPEPAGWGFAAGSRFSIYGLKGA